MSVDSGRKISSESLGKTPSMTNTFNWDNSIVLLFTYGNFNHSDDYMPPPLRAFSARTEETISAVFTYMPRQRLMHASSLDVSFPSILMPHLSRHAKFPFFDV